MSGQNVQNEVKFPENRKYLKYIKRGDWSTLAEYSGYTNGSVKNMFYGFRAITDRLKKAFIRMIEERNALNDQLETIVKDIEK